MSSRNAPKRIPLRNEDREILKTGVYKCCNRKWKATLVQVIQDGRKLYALQPKTGNEKAPKEKRNVCKRCRKKLRPAENRDRKKRMYGHFNCTGINAQGKRCGRTWTSSLTWTLNNQIQTTKCKACNTETMPYQLVSLFLCYYMNHIVWSMNF